jgi:hypothetical protein
MKTNLHIKKINFVFFLARENEDKSACAQQSGDDTEQSIGTLRLPERVYKIFPPTDPLVLQNSNNRLWSL